MVVVSSTRLLSFVTFGELLRYLRRRARLTQRELSIAVGYSESQISRLEKNQRLPDVAALLALFVPALDLEDEPEMVARLLEMAAATRAEGQPASVTVTRAVRQEIVEEVSAFEEPPPGNLPRPLTTFIGRERETAGVKQLLTTARLVTLAGSGGCGKTRLALAVAAQLQPAYRHGVWFLELAPLLEASLVPQAAAAVLDVQVEAGRPLLPALTAYLRPRHLLLLLDNCEHVVAAAAQLAQTLLQDCPLLQVMATSRELLGVPGEQVFQVPPLALPDPADFHASDKPPIAQVKPLEPSSWPSTGPAISLEALSRYEAVQLFVERAQSALPGFTLTAENAAAALQVCWRLDGIPLAIELAAARVRFLRVEEIAARLDDRFRLLANGDRTALLRQRALRAAIDWSYDLLTPAEQALLRRLSVFAGGWTLAAAESVSSDQYSVSSRQSKLNTEYWPLDSDHWPLDTLSSLVNKSLVVAERRPGTEARYHLLETIRQYALEKLVESGEAEAARLRHLRFFLALAETAGPELHGPGQIAWLNRLESEHDNLRAALAYALDQDVEAGTRLLLALWPFWQARGYGERGEWLKRLATLPAPLPDTVAGARVRSLAAATADDPAEAERLFAESVALCRELGDRWGMAYAFYLQGHVAWWQNYRQARALFEQSLALYRELDDRWGMAEVLRDLGELAQVHHEHRATARAFMEESLQLCREAGDRRGVAMALVHLGDVVQEQGDLVAGQAYCQEGLSLSREVGYRPGILWGLLCLGIIAWGQGDYETAAARLEEALSAARAMGTKEFAALAFYWLATAVRFQGDGDQAARMYEENVTLSREAGLPWLAGHSLYGLGEIIRSRGDLEAAAVLHIEALATLRDLDFRWVIAYSLDALAMLAVAQQQAERAARLFGAAAALREALGSALYPVERPEYETHVAAARAALGDEAFAAAWVEGRSLALDQAIAYALDSV